MRNLGRTVMVAGAVIALGLAAGGCSSIRDHRGYVADAMLIDSVQPGIDNRTSVERTLGRPTLISQFGEKQWYYLSMNTKQAAFRRPRTADQTLVRVSFDDAGKVTAVDKRGMEQVVRLDPNGNVTPTLGRDRSFLQDLFGNIGAVGTPGGTAAPQGPGPNGS